MRLTLTERQLEILQESFARWFPGTEVWAVGSRVKGTAVRTSDLDLLVLAGEEQRQSLSSFQEEMEEGPLPFIVDAHLITDFPERLVQAVRQEKVVLWPSPDPFTLSPLAPQAPTSRTRS